MLRYDFFFPSWNDKLHSFSKLTDHKNLTLGGCVWIIAVFSHFFCRLESYVLIFFLFCVNFPNGH